MEDVETGALFLSFFKTLAVTHYVSHYSNILNTPYIFYIWMNENPLPASVSIQSIAYHLPEKVITNSDLVKEFPFLSEEDIFRKTGVRKRYVRNIGINETGSDLGFHAAEKLFEKHPTLREKIDFILFCTQGADYKAPATACVLQQRLQLNKHCGAIDIPMGCTGFVNGLGVAKGLIATGQASNVLLITAEIASSVIHPDDHELRMLFGDAAAATWISDQDENAQIGEFIHGSDGSGAKNLIVNYSGTREPLTPEWLKLHEKANGMSFGKMSMNGMEIFLFALRTVPAMVRQLLDKSGLAMDDIQHFVFHQPNSFLLETLRKKLNIPSEKFIVSLENTGNTVSCTIPIALEEAKKNNTFKKGDRVLLAAFGIGYSWSATILTIN